MAFIIKGKNAGESVTIHQFCNDWFTVDTVDEQGKVVSPINIRLNPEEVAMVLQAASLGHTGIMFREFELRDDGTFKRRGRRR